MQPVHAPDTAVDSPRSALLVDEILGRYRTELDGAFVAYRNHVCRVLSLCELLTPLSDVDRAQLRVAGCFHDLGIWTHRTFDYLDPSRELAKDYLEREGRQAWLAPVLRIINDHHKILGAKDRLANCFRRADWIDVTQGTLRFGVPRERIRELAARYPNAGFHRLLVKLALRHMLRRPWNPLPMMRW